MEKTHEFCIHRNHRRIGGFLGAFLAIIAIFFVVPIFEKNFYTHLLLQCSFILLILSTIYTIDGQRPIFNVGLVILIPFLYFDSLGFYFHSMSYMLVAYGFSLLFTSLSIVVVMKKILRANHVNAELIFGALMVYLLSGILWANFYFIENILAPGSFQGASSLKFGSTTLLNSFDQQFNFLYYSFATLATLGLGDISPLNHLAKSLTVVEAIFGQLYVAIIIAKLVSVWWYVPNSK